MFNNKTNIRKRVIQAIEKKIEEAQKGLDNEIVQIDKEAEIKKDQAAEKWVDSILGKLK